MHFLIKFLQEVLISILIYLLHCLVKLNLLLAYLLIGSFLLVQNLFISQYFLLLQQFFFLFLCHVKIVGLKFAFSNLVIDLGSGTQLHQTGHTSHRSFFNSALVLLHVDLFLDFPGFKCLPGLLNEALFPLPLTRLPFILTNDQFESLVKIISFLFDLIQAFE
jgi:hypothetical protein